MAKKLNNEKMMEKIIEKNGVDSWELVSKDRTYSNVHMHHKFRCLKCGVVYEKRVNDLLHGFGCSNCAGLYRRTNDEFIRLVSEIDNDYKLLIPSNSKNVRTRDKLEFIHVKCGNIFKMKIHNFITVGERCPRCMADSLYTFGSTSKGEKIISSILNENNVEFVSQCTFDNCKSNYIDKMLPFDFYIPSKKVLIEFDGIQHFKSVDYFGGEKSFNRLIENDKIKNDYAKTSGLEMIRIKYTEIDIINDILMERGIINAIPNC